jgi:hypothetical protein
MTQKTIWPDKHRNAAQKVIDRLLSTRKPEGWEISFQFQFDLRVLAAWSTLQELRDGTILSTITKMHAAGQTTIYDFEVLYFQWLDELNRNAAINRRIWSFYIPFAISPAKDVKYPVNLRLLSSQVTFASWRRPIRKFGAAALKHELRRRTTVYEFNPPPTCLILCAAGNNIESAWREVEPVFDSLRGLVEMTLGFGRRTIFFAGRKRPRRTVKHPEWMFATDDSNEITALQFHTETDESDSKDVNRQTFRRLKQNARLFRDIPLQKSTCALLVDVLRLYAQALDAAANYQYLLNLWQLAESITLAERYQGGKQTVVSRLAWLFMQETDCEIHGIEEVLAHLYHKRCKIVHEGLHNDVTDDDVNFMKRICEAGIVWLWKNVAVIQTEEQLEVIFTWAKRNSAALKTAFDGLKFLRQQRSESP